MKIADAIQPHALIMSAPGIELDLHTKLKLTHKRWRNQQPTANILKPMQCNTTILSTKPHNKPELSCLLGNSMNAKEKKSTLSSLPLIQITAHKPILHNIPQKAVLISFSTFNSQPVYY